MSRDMIGQINSPADTLYLHATNTTTARNTRHLRDGTRSLHSRKNLDHVETHENTDDVEKLKKTIEEKDLEIKRLQWINSKITQQKDETEERSLQITREMAKITTAGRNFENIDDELSISKITERFQKLYSYDWVHLLRWLIKTFPDVSELQAIKCLSTLLKYGYQECQIIADSQIRHFLLFDMTETVSTNEQFPELFLLRRNYSQRESVRRKVIQVILQKILLADNLNIVLKGERRNDAIQKLQGFFNKYLDCCWLMTISNPPVTLNFNVIGCAYRDYTEQFTKYSPKTPVEDNTKTEDTICEVVWPSVCLHSDSAYCQKGDVIVVAKGIIQENSNCNCCTYQKHDNRSTRRVREDRQTSKMLCGNKPKPVEKHRPTKQSYV